MPLSPDSLLKLGLVSRAIQEANFRSSGPRPETLPGSVAEALQILDDADFQAVSATLHPTAGKRPALTEALTVRRDLLRALRTRYPEAMAAIRAARGPASIVVSPYFFVHMVTGPCRELTLEDADPCS